MAITSSCDLALNNTSMRPSKAIVSSKEAPTLLGLEQVLTQHFLRFTGLHSDVSVNLSDRAYNDSRYARNAVSFVLDRFAQ